MLHPGYGAMLAVSPYLVFVLGYANHLLAPTPNLMHRNKIDTFQLCQNVKLLL